MVHLHKQQVVSEVIPPSYCYVYVVVRGGTTKSSQFTRYPASEIDISRGRIPQLN